MTVTVTVTVTVTMVAMACAVGLAATTVNALAADTQPAASAPRTTSSTIAGVLQPVDLYDVFSARRVLSDVVPTNGRFVLSPSSGESTMRDYAGRDADVTGAGFRARAAGSGARSSISQNVAGVSNSARAVATYHSLVKAERSCQHEPKGHWRYGAAHTLSFQGGTATWMRSFSGDSGTPDGGVTVPASTSRTLGARSRVGGRRFRPPAIGTLHGPIPLRDNLVAPTLSPTRSSSFRYQWFGLRLD